MAAETEGAAAGAANVDAIYPLTSVQAGILFHGLYAPESPLYFQQYSALLEGPLDVDAFAEAWRRVAARHDALRSLMVWEGRERPLQIVRHTVTPEWRHEDWRGAGVGEQEERLAEFLESDRARGFQLDVAPLMRFALLRLADTMHRFVWSHHHIVLDGWSLGIVLDEVFEVYAGLAAGRNPELTAPAEYRSYVQWLQHRNAREAATEHWGALLAGFDTPTGVLAEIAPQASPWAERHAETVVTLDAATHRALQNFARENGLTPNTVVRGAWALVLSRYSGADDVVFGATVSGRPPELPGALQMVGLFINTLPVRTRIDPAATLVDWLVGIQDQQMAGGPFEATPLPDVQRWSGVDQGTPLFQTLLVFENVPAPETTAAGLRTRDVRYLQRSNYPLAILAMPGEELELIFLYDRDRYVADVIGRMAGQLVHVLAELASGRHALVGDVPLFPPDELDEVVRRWNGTPQPYPQGETVDELISAVAGEHGHRTAVVDHAGSVSYRELIERAEVLAARLRAGGARPGTRVAIALERGGAMVVAILGVLRTGAAYVPVDPRFPAARLQWILSDTEAVAVVVAEPAAAQQMRDLAPGLSIVAVAAEDASGAKGAAAPSGAVERSSEDLAYVMYTSGSTGRPKGVAVTHRNLVSSTWARRDAYPDRVDSFLLLSPFFFDSSVAGIFATLTDGGTIVLPEPDMEKDVVHLASLVADHRVTHTLALPTLYELLLENAPAGALDSLRLVMVAGEPCPPSLPALHEERVPNARLVNEYGPTEATVWCTMHPLGKGVAAAGPRVPIGKPIANSEVFVLDTRGRPAPVGVPGELHVAGDGVARGYLNDETLTADRFVERSMPVAGWRRMYRTGDVARFLPDGSLDLIGRLDDQVKVRGQRIELGEIESVLRKHPLVGEAVVKLDPQAPPARTRVVAFVEPAIDEQGLVGYLTDRLPAAMIPASIVTMGQLPRGPTGKIDRLGLEDFAPAPGGAAVAPHDDVERTLAEIWAGVLGVATVGVHDNFFDLGGDSILSIRIIARAHQAGIAIRPRQLFDHPTVAGLAAVVRDASAS